MTHLTRRFAILLIIAGSIAVAAPVFAQGGDSVVLLLDRNAIAADQQSTSFTAADVNAPIATVGLRDSLPYFSGHAGETVTLPGGGVGQEGWFALTAAPAGWASDSGLNDGAENFVFAGPGLGSPDATGSRSTLLSAVPGVTALDSNSLSMLAGYQVCGVVYDQVLTPTGNGSADLSGPNLGLVAFRVVGAGAGQVQVQILGVNDICNESLALFTPAP